MFRYKASRKVTYSHGSGGLEVTHNNTGYRQHEAAEDLLRVFRAPGVGEAYKRTIHLKLGELENYY